MFKKIISALLLLCIICCSTEYSKADGSSGIEGVTNGYQPTFSRGNEDESVYESISFTEGCFFSDIKNNKDRNIAETLNSLGFLSGTSVNEFGPDEKITKAEFVSAVIKMLNFGDFEMTPVVYFKDVPLENENANYIAKACALGIILCNEEKIFMPSRAISFNEAVTILVRAAGYGVIAETTGGYPTGYISRASYLGIGEASDVSDVNTLTRMEAARLMYNTFDVKIMNQLSISGKKIEYEKNEDFLYFYHKIRKETGVVNSTCVSSTWDYEKTSCYEIMVGEQIFKVPYKRYLQYLGHRVEIYYTDEDGIKSIVYLSKSTKQTERILLAKEINSFTGLSYNYGENEKVYINARHTLIVNGICLKNYTEKDFVPLNGEVILLGDLNGGYDTVIVNSFYAFMFKSLSVYDNIVVFDSVATLPSVTFDLDNSQKTFEIYINGRQVDFYADAVEKYNADGVKIKQYKLPDIPQNSVINIFSDKYEMINGRFLPSDDARYVRLVITSDYAEGNVTAIGENDLYIDDNRYELAKDNILNRIDTFKIGVSGKFLIDFDGKIFSMLYDENNKIELEYAYIIKGYFKNGISSRVKLCLMDTDGNCHNLSCAEKVLVNGKLVKNQSDIWDMLTKNASYLEPTYTISQLIKYSTDDNGQINRIELAVKDREYALTEDQPVIACPSWIGSTSTKLDLGSRYENGNKLYLTTGAYSGLSVFGNPKIKFIVPDRETFIEDEYGVFNIWAPEKGIKTVELYDCDDNMTPEIMIQYYNADQAVASETVDEYVLVDKVYSRLDEDGIVRKYMRAVTATRDSMDFYVENDSDFDGIQCGDLIKIFHVNDKIINMVMVMPIEKIKNFNLNSGSVNYGSQTENVFELYSLFDDVSMVLQRGKPTEDGKREKMQCNHFGEMDWGSFLYDATGKTPVVGRLYNASVLDCAQDVGNDVASVVFIRAHSTVTKFIVGYKGLR